MGIGTNIKCVLSDKQISIKQLADISGVPVNTLYSITQRDSKRVQGDILQKIALALGVSTDVLIYGEEIDRDFELVCESLDAAGFSLDATGFMDNYYVWHTDTENIDEDRVELDYNLLLDIVKRVERDAEANKARYMAQRYETDLFAPWQK